MHNQFIHVSRTGSCVPCFHSQYSICVSRIGSTSPTRDTYVSSALLTQLTTGGSPPPLLTFYDVKIATSVAPLLFPSIPAHSLYTRPRAFI